MIDKRMTSKTTPPQIDFLCNAERKRRTAVYAAQAEHNAAEVARAVAKFVERDSYQHLGRDARKTAKSRFTETVRNLQELHYYPKVTA